MTANDALRPDSRPDAPFDDTSRFDETTLPGVPLPVVGAPRHVTVIDNADCIGCTKCILACPFDAIVGALKHQHHVIAARCTGCDLCAAPCPTDCISSRPLTAPWSEPDVARARRQAEGRLLRRQRAQPALHGQPGPHRDAEPGSSQDTAMSGMAKDPVRDTPSLAVGTTTLDRLGTPGEKQRRLSAILATVAHRNAGKPTRR